MPKVKTVPKLCLDLDSPRGELVWFGLESIFAHATPQHPFSKLLGAQCSSSTNGLAVTIFIKCFCDIVIFPVFKAPRGAVLVWYKWSPCHDFYQLFNDFAIFSVFKAPRGAVLTCYKSPSSRHECNNARFKAPRGAVLI